MPTPKPSTPEAVIASIGRLVKRLAKVERGSTQATPVGLGLPGVTIDGVLKTAANIDPGWVDFPVVERLGKVLEPPGLDRQRRRRGGDRGDAVRDGPGPARRRHLPDPRDGRRVRRVHRRRCSSRTPSSARWRSAADPPSVDRPPAARTRRGLSWKAWAQDLDEHLDAIDAADVAEPDDPRRRRQQERRQVHPAPDRCAARSCRRSCATTRASSARRSSRPKGSPPTRRHRRRKHR